ncbi:type IV toxin-antitoxin system AbiEi family antitoxin domain-containing protein [Flagellimonas onchidii]|uniref:type IV toxin-antitoxin system AbiEi family antitoxin domain-containing protein n=1 Tax=Flagellimonas onchidii TaxID=2562684 RepID=UPI0010A631F4|nr:type IV toxin-antitoxin system AbiEi family antitoxin [Allomuricauda onchidii]
MQLSSFVKDKLSSEQYAFSRAEYITYSGKNSNAVTTDLAYLSKKKEILALRKGFYLIIPPRYSKLGIIPLELYVHKLFEHLNKAYYVGLYSAARLHGAAHQQTQIDYVITQGSRMLDIRKKAIALDFFLTKNWPQANIVQRKSDAGYFNVSDPLLTIADLLYHQRKLGGINRMLANIEELLEEVTQGQVNSLLQWYPHKSVLQRLGFLLEYIAPQNNQLDPIYEYLMKQQFYPVFLNTADKNKPGSVDNRWKVDVNMKLESDI